MTEKKYELSVGCIYKNESNSICEWIEHYILHGVEHFYMINDNSTDNSVELIQKYVDSGIVSLFNGAWQYYLGRQRDMYNHFILPRIKETQWLIIIDMDEYLWSRTSIDLKDVFKICLHIAQIQFQHTLFGSNGHIEQPNGIVKNFTKRDADQPTKFMENLKYAINTNFDFISLNIHHATFSDVRFQEKEYFMILGEPYFLLNHYCCQSIEFWKNIKCTRGDGDHYRIRLMEHFYEYDKNDVEDFELLKQNMHE